jgi:hypothetical protein
MESNFFCDVMSCGLLEGYVLLNYNAAQVEDSSTFRENMASIFRLEE